MDFLARREYGRAELVARLEAGGFRGDAASEAVDRLADEGLQDDARFVESFVHSRVRQGKGPQRIRQELGQRGLSPELVERMLDAIGADWFDHAREARLKKFGAGLPADFKDKAKQMRFLQYRGFESSHIQFAMSAD